MRILITLLFCFGLSLRGLTQKLIKDYKLIADKSLFKFLDTNVISKVQCDRFTITDSDGSGRYFYEENKNKRIAFSRITFGFSLFDSILNSDIYFYVSVNQNYQVINDSSIIKKIPLCIRRGQSCNFIPSDSAKRIAIKDSIKYVNDLSFQLERNKFDKEYYWIITGHRPSDRPKSNKPSLNVYVETISTDQRRIINAQTGLIVTYKQFDYDW